ncbi:hypothetical protein ACFQ5D_02655 [Paenibacillus farraposensis]|uniref:Uncharacterized protein n=1 Tax=Paenibacillus farraposensis TaxID=2807095 RepID=A0ABW4D9E9_9BACL|nr:hypothetical protein [Paenibacillus farraposensis]MCC3381793.1 hypothetical protein [Paenibacillus farraposensis]
MNKTKKAATGFAEERSRPDSKLVTEASRLFALGVSSSVSDSQCTYVLAAHLPSIGS